MARAWAEQADLLEREWKEDVRRRRNKEAMAWVGLLSLLIIGAIAVYIVSGGFPERAYVLLGTVFVGLGLVVRLLVLALGREGNEPD